MSFSDNHERMLFIPIGGSQEIGMNASLYVYKGSVILVDCGIGFYGDSVVPNHGIDICVPDFYAFSDLLDKVCAVFITHGHDDHIGALKFFSQNKYGLSKFNCPIYTTEFTSALISSKVPLASSFDFVTVKHGDEINVGEMKVRILNITHSIPQSSSLFIQSSGGNVFHTGDWKFDNTPIIGDAVDMSSIKQCGDEGVDAVVSDSTNVHERETSNSEHDIVENIEAIFSNDRGRIFVTCFSSNVARVVTFIRLAQKAGRTPLILGRSMQIVLDAARDSGLIDKDIEYYSAQGNFESCPKDKAMIICTGSQGEAQSALFRLACGSHDHAYIEGNDLVIFSSRIIPGNEKKVYQVCNMLAKKGVDIIMGSDAKVHVGGHPDQNDMEELYTMLRPKSVIPVHGEYAHICRHKKFAQSFGIKNVVIAFNGSVIDIVTGDTIEEIECSSLIASGKRLLYKNHPVVMQRALLYYSGIITVVITLNKKMALASDPYIYMSGILDEDDVRHRIKKRVSQYLSSHDLDFVALKRSLRRVIIKSVSGITTTEPKLHLHINK